MFKRTLPTVYFLVLILLSVQLPVLSESQKIRRSESLKVSVNRYSLEGVVYKVIKAPEFGFVYITVRKLGRYIVYIFNSEGLLKVVNPYRPFFAYSSLLRALVSITRNNSKVVILDPLNLDIERSLASITRPPQATTPIDIICEGDKLVICYMGAFSAEGATRTGRMIQVYSLILGRELWHTRLKVGVYVDVYSCQFSPNGEYLVIHGTDTLCRICREWSDFIEIVKSTTGEKITNRDASKYGKSWYKALSEGVLISVENKYSRHKWQTIFIDYKGDLKWAFSKDDPTEKYYDAVEIDEAIIYSSITSKGQALGAIDKNTGSRLWRFEFSDSQPFKLDGAKDGRLIAANSDRATLYDIDGRKLWEYKFNDGYQVDYCLWIDSNTFIVAKTNLVYFFKIKTERKYLLKIDIKDDKGSPLKNTILVIYNASDMSLLTKIVLKEKSSTTLTLPKGDYLIQVEKEGYGETVEKISLSANMSLTINLNKIVKKKSSEADLEKVEVRLVDLYGKPLRNSEVILYRKISEGHYQLYSRLRTSDEGLISWVLKKEDKGIFKIVVPKYSWSKEIAVEILPCNIELQVLISEKYPLIIEAIIPPKVSIKIFNESGLTVYSDDIEGATVVELKPGLYKLEVFAEGYKKEVKVIKVPEVMKVSLYLEEEKRNKENIMLTSIKDVINTLKEHSLKSEILNRRIPAPQFKVIDVEGRVLSLRTFKNKIIILEFFYIGCHGCEDLIPLLHNLSRYDNVVIISIDVRPNIDTRDKLLNYMERFNITWYVVGDTSNLAEVYRISATPTVFVIKDGYILASFVGYKENIVTTGPGYSKIILRVKLSQILVLIAIAAIIYIIYEELKE